MTPQFTARIVDASCTGQGREVGEMVITTRPTPEEAMLANLRALADRTHSQLLELAKEPTRDRCDLMVAALADVSTQVRRLGVELGRQPK